jgi:hypothetical protein
MKRVVLFLTIVICHGYVFADIYDKLYGIEYELENIEDEQKKIAETIDYIERDISSIEYDVYQLEKNQKIILVIQAVILFCVIMPYILKLAKRIKKARTARIFKDSQKNIV